MFLKVYNNISYNILYIIIESHICCSLVCSSLVGVLALDSEPPDEDFEKRDKDF